MCTEEVLHFDEESIDRDRIVNDEYQLLNDLFCPICYGLLWKPRSCISCQNLFCNKCIQTWLNANSTTCPLCRSLYKDKPTSLSILTHFAIRCRNISLGCTEILPYDLLEQHENIDCKFLTKKCRVCEQIVLVADIDQHKNICKPIVIQCRVCQSFVKVELFDRHQDECSQRYEQLFLPLNFSNEILFSTTNEIDFVGIELFNQARRRACLIRLLGMFQLMFINLRLIHLILFNLFGWGCGDLINLLTTYFHFIQTWISTSIYQSFIFITILSMIFNYSLSFLLKLLNDTFIILFLTISLIIWSSMNSKLHLHQFQMNLNMKEILLFCILILLFFQVSLLILRFYFEYIPIHIRAICLTIIFFSNKLY